MKSKNLYKLIIDDEFKRLIPPLLVRERQQLEDNIRKEGCLDPLIVWNQIIVDGHNRYEICWKYKIPFEIKRIFFERREEAILWICAHQLGRRNLTEESRRYLIGKQYGMEKIVGCHNPTGVNQHSPGDEVRSTIDTEPQTKSHERTRERLGKQYHITPMTVNKYFRFSKAVDRISDAAPSLADGIMAGRVKMSQENIVLLSEKPEHEIVQFGAELATTSSERSRYSDTRLICVTRKLAEQVPKKEPPIPVHIHVDGSVKDLPEDDPNQPAITLTLTIPSWISMIDRTMNQMSAGKASNETMGKLWIALVELQETIEKLVKITEESI